MSSDLDSVSAQVASQRLNTVRKFYEYFRYDPDRDFVQLTESEREYWALRFTAAIARIAQASGDDFHTHP